MNDIRNTDEQMANLDYSSICVHAVYLLRWNAVVPISDRRPGELTKCAIVPKPRVALIVVM